MSETKTNNSNILIVDDQLSNLKILMDILAGHGYHARPAINGEVALRAIAKNPPDLILLDILMPGMTGFEVCEQLKANAETQNIPVIFISALSDTENKLKAFAAGGVDYVTKPFQTEEVLARVKTHLALQRVQQQLKDEIAERARAEQDLHIKDNAIETSINAIAMADLSGNLTYVNDAFLKLWGLADRAAALGRPAVDFWDTKNQAAAVIEALRQRGGWIGELVGKRADGTLFPVELSASLVTNANGHPICMMASFLDITRRKEAEASRQQYIERLQILRDIDQSILAAASPEEIAESSLVHLRKLIPFKRGSVVTFNAKAEQAEVIATYTEDYTPTIKKGVLIPLDTFRELIASKQTRIIPNMLKFTQGEMINQTLHDEGVHVAINVPLIIQDSIVGTLNLGSEDSACFTTERIAMTEEVATSLAIALQQAQLYEQTRSDSEAKAVLLREINHRVKNNLSAIIGLLLAEKRHLTSGSPSEASDMIDDLISRIQGLTVVHTMLSKSQWLPVSLSELVKQVIQSVLKMAPVSNSISVDVAPTAVQVTPKQASSLGIIINELTTNTLKHGLGERNTAAITVRIQSQDGDLILEFHNDGLGYPEKVLNLQHHNVGLYLIQRIVQINLEGKLTLKNDQGAVTIIQFPEKYE